MELKNTVEVNRSGEKSALSEFFNGNMDISTSFWGYLVGSNIVSSIAFTLIKPPLIQAHAVVGFFFFLVVLNAWFIFTLIGTWRSNTKHCSSTAIKLIVRTIIVLGFARVAALLSLFAYGFLLS